MPNAELKETAWVDNFYQLKRIAANFSGIRYLAVDTESNSLFAYQEQVCLVQFSVETND